MSISLLLLFRGHLSRRFLNVANFDSFFFKLAYYGVCETKLSKLSLTHNSV